MSAYHDLQRQLLANPKVWLVTGVAGFIGSNILEKLLQLNQRVIGLDNFSTGFQQNLEEVLERVTDQQRKLFNFVKGDIRDLDTCKECCNGVDIILHQAALGSVPRSINDPISSNQSNVDGFLNMLVAAKEAKVKRFVFASSSSVYGDLPDLPKVEERVGNPLSPYAVTKLVNELYAGVFGKIYDIQWVGLRYFNVFGPRQNPDGPYAAVIPKWFAGMLQGEEIFINGDGQTSRDFCYVANAVQANLLAGWVSAESAVNQVYNVAFCQRTTLNELFSLIKSQVVKVKPDASNLSPIYMDFRAGDVRHSLADISKATQKLGYEPAYSVKDGIKEAADWYFKKFA